MPERVDPVRSHIAGGWLIGVPDVAFHEYTLQAVVAVPKPTWVNHPPRPIRNNLSSTNALVFDPRSKLVVAYAHGREHIRYFAGCGSGLVTGARFLGSVLGGGGLTGSSVGDTGSARGMTVYLLTDSPIRANADLPWWMASKKCSSSCGHPSTRSLRGVGQLTSAAVVVPHANNRFRVPAPLALQRHVSEEGIAVRALPTNQQRPGHIGNSTT